MKHTKNLVKLRKLMMLGRTELANALGVEYVSVQAWELGNRHPNMRNCRAMADLAKKQGIDKVDGKSINYEFFRDL